MHFSDRETLLKIIDELDTFTLNPAMEPLIDEVAEEMEEDEEVQQQLRQLQGEAEEDYYDAAFNQKLASLLLQQFDSFTTRDKNLYGIKSGQEILLSPLI
jgi:hypothetical protein